MTLAALEKEARRLTGVAEGHKRQSRYHRRAAQAAMVRRADLIMRLQKLGVEVEFKPAP